MFKKLLKIFSFFSFFFLIFYFIHNANLPFVGPFGNNNATYSIQAKNYIKYGLLKTKFAPVNKEVNGKFQYYLHHPPLLQLSTALSYEIFGKIFGSKNWWQGRLFPIVSTVASILFISLIAKNLFGRVGGFLALFLGSTSPFLLSFGKIIQFEPLLLVIILIFTFLAGKEKNKKNSLLLGLLAIIGSLIDWPMIVFLFLFYFLNKRQSRNFQPYLLLSSLVLILFFIYASLLSGPKELFSAFLGRSLGNELFGKTFFPIKLILLQLVRIVIYFTPLGFASAVYFFKKKKKDTITLVFFLFGLTYLILFLNGAYAHPYWLYYLTPFFILMSANLLTKIFDNKKRFWLGVMILLANTVFSIIIINFKDQQIKKALWQDEFINQTTEFLLDNEEIGTSWDFNEELFRYKTNHPIEILWSKDQIIQDTIQFPKWRYFIFSCWANCTSEDAKIGEILSEKHEMILKEDKNRAFLFDLSKPKKKMKQDVITKETQIKVETPIPLLWRFYRKTRDFLGVNQI